MNNKMNNPESKSVAIIGGGVIGMSTAFHLAEKGVSKITVIDKGNIGGGSSLQAAGIVTSLEWNETAIRARLKTLDNFERFSQILEGYSFHQVGCLNLSSEEDYITDKDLRDLQISLGSKVEVLQGEQLTDRFSNVIADYNEYGVLDLRGGYSEPHRYVPALQKKIKDMGVQIREYEEVVDFDLDGSQVKGIVTRSSVTEKETKEKFDVVICAVNAWINHLLSLVDFQIPMKNFIHERFVTKPFDTKLNLPAINDRVVGGYIRPTEDNRLLVGTDAHNPENFLTIILDERSIQQNLFTKDNKFYDYLLKTEQEDLSFYMIPNLDINDRFLKGMMNIGQKPTVDGKGKSLEVHIFDFSNDIYGKAIKVKVIKKSVYNFF